MICPLRLDVDPLPEGSPAWWVDEALVKRHCRVDFDDDDTLLYAYLKASIEWVETITKRTIVPREHRWVLKEFPSGRGNADYMIWLPRGKTISVDSIDYSVNGERVTLTGPSSGSPAGTDYQEDLNGADGGVLMPRRGGSWPTHDSDVPAPVTIYFVAGYAASEIPGDLLAAILLGTSDGYDLRGAADLGALSLSDNGKSLAARIALVSPYAVPRWY